MWWVATGAALLAAPVPAAAQGGTIAGTVTDSMSGEPLVGVDVTVRRAEAGASVVVRTDGAGAYRASPLQPGAYVVRFERAGWEPLEHTADVEAGTTLALSVRLVPRPFRILGVSTVARVRQPLLEAPASVSVLARDDLERQPQLTVLEQLRTLPGLDIIQTGLVEGQMIPRGFSRLFNARVLLLTDGRIAQLPGTRANLTSLIPATSLDTERIELVRGPASALYGPDAAHGVLQIFTKSPFDDPGMSFALSGGVREQGPVEGFARSAAGLVQMEGRIAVAPSGHWAAKVSGRWFQGTDFRHQDSVEVARRSAADACLADPSDPGCASFGPSPNPDRLARVGRRDFALRHGTLDARVDWVPNERTELSLSSGLGWLGDGIGLVGGGAVQVGTSTFRYGQLRVRAGGLSGQAYVNDASLDDAYTLREGIALSEKSTFVAAQAQHALTLAEWQRVVYGVDAQLTLRESDQGGPFADRDISIVGAFVQSETGLTSRWKLVAAGRVDDHSVLPEAIVSPRLAVIFTPTPDHSLRATYNRAFTTPLPSFLFQDNGFGRIPLAGPYGYPKWSQGSGGNGFSFERIDGRPAMKTPLAPLIGADPETFLPSTVEQLYVLAREYLRSIGSSGADVMDAAGTPTPAAGVDVRLMMANTQGQPGPFPGGMEAVRDVPALREESTMTLELGYTGVLWERALLSIDAYYSEKGAFLGPFQPVTPHVYLDGEDLVAFFVSRGVDEATARSVAIGTNEEPGISKLPLGVITPNGVSNPGPTYLVTASNYGDVSLFGGDVSLDVRANDEWTGSLSVSFVSDDLFDAEGLTVPLNAPKLKWSAGLSYHGFAGLDASAWYRFTAGYPARSLVFDGEVDGAHVFDAGLGYRLPGSTPLRFHLDVQNVLNSGYRTFVGAPALGRVTILRAVWGT